MEEDIERERRADTGGNDVESMKKEYIHTRLMSIATHTYIPSLKRRNDDCKVPRR